MKQPSEPFFASLKNHPYHIVTDEVRVTFPQFLAFTSLSGTSQFQMKPYLWIRKQFLRQEGGFPEAERPDWTLFSTRCLPVTSQRHGNCGIAGTRERSSTRVLLAGAIACTLSLKRRTHIFMGTVILMLMPGTVPLRQLAGRLTFSQS